MLVLSIKTDQPDAHVSLYDDKVLIGQETWRAHRQLAETIHIVIGKLLERNHRTYQDIDGVACYKGPGSFTGLRIGVSVANALAYGLSIPIISTDGEEWLKDALKELKAGKNEEIALPEYGAPVHITQQRK